MQRKWLISLISIFGISALLISCEEEKEVVDFKLPFAIQEVEIPAVLSSTSDRAVLFTARVTHPEGSAGMEKVEVLMTDSAGLEALSLELFDDGGSQNTQTGDIIAFDQVYSQSVVPSQLGLPDGNYQVKVQALSRSGETKASAGQTLEIFPNQTPEIVNFSFPDSIPSGMPPTQIIFTVNDNDGLEDIRWVIIQGFEQGIPFPAFQDTVFNPFNNSAVLDSTIDSSYAAGKKGDYELNFFAEDRVGDVSDEESQNVFIENIPPVIWNAVVPDTLQIPSSGDISVKITVNIDDGQSLADIDSVYFNSILPNGNPSSGNPFLMFDNGLPFNSQDPSAVGDDIAGDGIYTLTIFLPAGTPTGEYTFNFYARDKVGQLSAGPVKILHAI